MFLWIGPFQSDYAQMNVLVGLVMALQLDPLIGRLLIDRMMSL